LPRSSSRRAAKATTTFKSFKTIRVCCDSMPPLARSEAQIMGLLASIYLIPSSPPHCITPSPLSRCHLPSSYFKISTNQSFPPYSTLPHPYHTCRISEFNGKNSAKKSRVYVKHSCNRHPRPKTALSSRRKVDSCTNAASRWYMKAGIGKWKKNCESACKLPAIALRGV
jgi:hypothetical protein